MLKLDGVTFAHPGQKTPYVFNLELGPGDILGISGPSGSGKSTLLDLIAGFLTPRSGTIVYDQTNLTPLPPEQRFVSTLFQADNLFEHLSVSKNLDLVFHRDFPKDAKWAHIETALDQVGLEGFANRKASTLSGGQKQRVALARTLLQQNPIVLLDEPFSALDPETAEDMRKLVTRLTKEHQWHVIMVSHDETDMHALATRHMQIVDGRLKTLDQ